VGVNIYFNRGVHANYTETSDDLGVIGYLLGAQKELVVVLFPAVVESFEAFGRETDGSCGCEV
jgi:hypothetical protein